MSEHDETGDVQVVSAEDPGTDLAAEPGVEAQAGRADAHVITLRGADGFELVHLAGGCPADCAVGEAAGRISLAFCATMGRWTCDVDAGGLMLVERLSD